MSAVLSNTKFHKALNRYRTTYLNKNSENINESATRIIVNHLLSDVLGFRELHEVKPEYSVYGGFIDYMIKHKGKNMFIIEVKSFSTHLANKHLRQAIYYALMTGTDWIILTNGHDLEIYKLSFTKPIKIKKLLSIDLTKKNYEVIKDINILRKVSISKGSLKTLI